MEFLPPLSTPMHIPSTFFNPECTFLLCAPSGAKLISPAELVQQVEYIYKSNWSSYGERPGELLWLTWLCILLYKLPPAHFPPDDAIFIRKVPSSINQSCPPRCCSPPFLKPPTGLVPIMLVIRTPTGSGCPYSPSPSGDPKCGLISSPFLKSQFWSDPECGLLPSPHTCSRSLFSCACLPFGSEPLCVGTYLILLVHHFFISHF
jgi:hypothetical protein